MQFYCHLTARGGCSVPRVRIADMVIDMTNTDKAFFEHRLQAYRDDSEGAPDLSITFETPEEITRRILEDLKQ